MTNNKDFTQRFSNRVADYVKYRPGYPPQIGDYLAENCGLTATAVVVDVGSGTGKLSELFLARGNTAFGVEPNDAMRLAGEQLLQKFPNFHSVKGTAEQTTLPDHSADFITAGQAFHWFDVQPTQREFQRILKPGGTIALIWNSRDEHNSPFMQAYEQCMIAYCEEYGAVHHSNSDAGIYQLLGGAVTEQTFVNTQQFDLAGLIGRSLSSSYAPMPGHPKHEGLIKALAALFAVYASNGRITFPYRTNLFYGQITPELRASTKTK